MALSIETAGKSIGGLDQERMTPLLSFQAAHIIAIQLNLISDLIVQLKIKISHSDNFYMSGPDKVRYWITDTKWKWVTQEEYNLLIAAELYKE